MYCMDRLVGSWNWKSLGDGFSNGAIPFFYLGKSSHGTSVEGEKSTKNILNMNHSLFAKIIFDWRTYVHANPEAVVDRIALDPTHSHYRFHAHCSSTVPV